MKSTGGQDRLRRRPRTWPALRLQIAELYKADAQFLDYLDREQRMVWVTAGVRVVLYYAVLAGIVFATWRRATLPVGIQFGALAVGAIVAVAILLHTRREVLQQQREIWIWGDLCPHCGYDARKTRGPCPECGKNRTDA